MEQLGRRRSYSPAVTPSPPRLSTAAPQLHYIPPLPPRLSTPTFSLPDGRLSPSPGARRHIASSVPDAAALTPTAALSSMYLPMPLLLRQHASSPTSSPAWQPWTRVTAAKAPATAPCYSRMWGSQSCGGIGHKSGSWPELAPSPATPASLLHQGSIRGAATRVQGSGRSTNPTATVQVPILYQPRQRASRLTSQPRRPTPHCGPHGVANRGGAGEPAPSRHRLHRPPPLPAWGHHGSLPAWQPAWRGCRHPMALLLWERVAHYRSCPDISGGWTRGLQSLLLR